MARSRRVAESKVAALVEAAMEASRIKWMTEVNRLNALLADRDTALVEAEREGRERGRREALGIEDRTYTVGPAALVLRRAEPEEVQYGDRVAVCGEIHLPMGNNSPYIAGALHFGDRLAIGGERLRWDWGTKRTDSPHRWVGKTFFASAYSVAFKAAQEWAEGEVRKLVDALDARAKALADAER
jgi:hypothetical protein